ncbi:facilitated trehalose transporter Tret1-like [Halyomorpha halys]|uniref:facilitated trehalose transporter Tret1-like n=1 Tax=Halyomorpha halys TaxID=286706 RepID=UPI0006D4D7C5
MDSTEPNISTTATYKDKPSYVRAYLVVIAASLLHLSTGAVMGWSSPMLPQLNLTSIESSLVGSLYSLGAAPGPFVITLCLDTIGRKGSVYVLWSFFVISWILLLTSTNINIIYIARLVGGIGVGGACSGIPVYVSEIAITEIRGRLGSLSFMFIAFGALLVYCIGPYVDYYTLSAYGISVAFVFLIIFYFLPESPYYYIRKGRRKEASASLQRLRGYETQEKLDEEIADIEKTIYQETERVMSFQAALKTPVALKAIGISIFLVMMQQFACGNPISAYGQTIFENANLNFSATIVPIIYLFSSLFGFSSVILVNRYLKMKTAILISGFGCGILTGLLGLYFYLINNGVDLYHYSYLSVVAAVAGNLFIGLGVGPLIWPLVAELLPPAIKGIGTGICGFISSLTGFGCIGLFSIVANEYGYSTSFFGFAALMIMCTITSIFIVPDTTGKTFQEIQKMLAK